MHIYSLILDEIVISSSNEWKGFLNLDFHFEGGAETTGDIYGRHIPLNGHGITNNGVVALS